MMLECSTSCVGIVAIIQLIHDTHTYQHTTTIPLLSIALYTAVDSHARQNCARRYYTLVVQSYFSYSAYSAFFCPFFAYLEVLPSASARQAAVLVFFGTISGQSFGFSPHRGGPTFFNSDQVGPQLVLKTVINHQKHKCKTTFFSKILSNKSCELWCRTAVLYSLYVPFFHHIPRMFVVRLSGRPASPRPLWPQ